MTNIEFDEWLKTRPRYKPLDKWKPYLIPEIIDRHPTINNKMHAFISRIITGEMGHGKSMFAYKLMAKLDYHLNGYTTIDQEENSYKFALDNMVYHPEDLFARFDRTLNSDYPDWIWTLDDASIHMGKQLWNQDREAYWKLEDKIPTIRENVTCLLITTPKLNALAKPFRDFFDKKIKITLEEGVKRYPRRAKHYFKDYYPDDVHYCIHHPFDDKFSCLVPDPFYKWYRDKKKKALREYDERKKNRPEKKYKSSPEGEEETEVDKGD